MHLLALIIACAPLTKTIQAADTVRVASPDGRNVGTVQVNQGKLFSSLQRNGRDLLLPSQLGSEFRGAPRLTDSLTITASARDTVDQTWQQPWGEVAQV